MRKSPHTTLAARRASFCVAPFRFRARPAAPTTPVSAALAAALVRS
jgi:hypothetical protein